MALIKCSECGKEVSDKASVCQGCGCPIGTGQSSPISISTPMGKSQIFRFVGSFGFLLVAIGFFMPWASPRGLAALLINQLNGFHLASLALEGAEQLSETLVGVLLYACFIFAAIGLIIGVLSLAKITVPVLVDFAISLVCIVSFLHVLVVGILPDMDNIVLHSGFYVVIVGLIVAFFALSTTHKAKRESQTNNPFQKTLSYNISVLIPPAGLILFLVWKEASPEKAKACGKGAFIGAIFIGVMILLFRFLITPVITHIFGNGSNMGW